MARSKKKEPEIEWLVYYINNGNWLEIIKAPTKDEAISKFRDLVGYYTITKIEERKKNES